MELVSNHGVPKQLITYRGSNFVGELDTQFYRNIGVNHTPTTSYRPRSSSQAERFNQTLKNILLKLVLRDESNWYNHIWKALLICRMMKSSATKFSAAELLYGQRLHTRQSCIPLSDEEITDKDLESRIKVLTEILSNMRKAGYENISKEKSKQ
ncbi:Pro-Pol polyprotein [Smittium culicis]|uniref:Pro-Pol polyprotein n=1 Tax=Smittium culicis TaxID=133412 RepID=A0A1R1X2E6_9FUNG|nr:Pro-Pol polyprotein [Smittium culicis]